MSCYKAIRYLLVHSSPVAAIVGTRIYPVVVDEGDVAAGIAYPCLVITVISEQSLTFATLENVQIYDARVQVTAFARDYGTKESLLAAVVNACRSGNATIDGVTVRMIITGQLGPDFMDQGATKLFMQSQDFHAKYTL